MIANHIQGPVEVRVPELARAPDFGEVYPQLLTAWQ